MFWLQKKNKIRVIHLCRAKYNYIEFVFEIVSFLQNYSHKWCVT